jgi:hypothetical protein
MIEPRRDGREPIAVTHQESNMEEAFKCAIQNLNSPSKANSEKVSTRVICGIIVRHLLGG